MEKLEKDSNKLIFLEFDRRDERNIFYEVKSGIILNIVTMIFYLEGRNMGDIW